MVATPPIKLKINVKSLRVGDQMDLEAATTMTALVQWLVAHAGADMDELRALTLDELRTLAETIGNQLTTELTPSKQNGARS